MAEMDIKDLIGQSLVAVQEPWDADLENDAMRLVFNGGALIITALDHRGDGAFWYEAEKSVEPMSAAEILEKAGQPNVLAGRQLRLKTNG